VGGPADARRRARWQINLGGQVKSGREVKGNPGGLVKGSERMKGTLSAQKSTKKTEERKRGEKGEVTEAEQ